MPRGFLWEQRVRKKNGWMVYKGLSHFHREIKSRKTNCGPNPADPESGSCFYELSLIGQSDRYPFAGAFLENNIRFIFCRKYLENKEKLTLRRFQKSILRIFLKRSMGNTWRFLLKHTEQFCLFFFQLTQSVIFQVKFQIELSWPARLQNHWSKI